MRMTPDQYMAQLDLPEVYRVGGSVRDEEIGRSAKDSDYMVRGAGMTEISNELVNHQAQISPLRLREGGKHIGWRAKVKGLGTLEIVLPRTEISTGPGRHDFDILCDYDLPLEADAVRRDFTINALYRNVKTGEIVDPLGSGLTDLKRKLLHTTHSGSFAEDPLRILRALRFVSTLGFELSSGCYGQMVLQRDAVTGLTQKGVSGTALAELSKLLMGNKPGYACELMADSGVMAVFLPELADMLGFEQRSRYHEKTTSDHTWLCLEAAAAMHAHAPLRVRMALLFHDSGKPTMAWVGEDGKQHYYALSAEKAIELCDSPERMLAALHPHEYHSAVKARAALNRLNSTKELRSDVVTLIERHMIPVWENIKPIKVRKMRAEIGDALLHDLITHRTCDILGKGEGDHTEQLEVLAWIAAEQQRAIAANVPVGAKELKISGYDLKVIGASGPLIGELQRKLLHDVLAQPKLNTTEWLTGRATKYVKEAQNEG